MPSRPSLHSLLLIAASASSSAAAAGGDCGLLLAARHRHSIALARVTRRPEVACCLQGDPDTRWSAPPRSPCASGTVAVQMRAWIQPNTPCSSPGIYIGDKFYGRFMLTPFVQSRSFHATGHPWSKHKDYYKILGVPKDASQDDIKKSFHSLAKKYHPGTNRGNTAAKRMFQEIRDAYEASKLPQFVFSCCFFIVAPKLTVLLWSIGLETLRDPSKREQYDMIFSRGSRAEFDGSYHDTFTGSNNQRHDPFTEFHRQNDGPFSSKFYKIFSEVFPRDINAQANDIKVGASCRKYDKAKSHDRGWHPPTDSPDAEQGYVVGLVPHR